MKWKGLLGKYMRTFEIQKDEQKTIALTESGEYRVEILGSGAHAKIMGAFHTKGSEKIDITLTIVHKAPHTQAHTILKGVASDQSSIRFFGLIKIEPHCGDTQSFLEERILLLSDTAKAEAVPELEILTDDVKCSHAASISQIPEAQMFYLMSRGVSRREAEKMIVEGFLEVA
jgi:Fe-S cluster assembly scaffold protein SufB